MLLIYQCLQTFEGAREREVLEWLSPSSGFSKIQNETRDCRVEDTGEWLLEDWKYSNWCHSGGLFWVHGVGKRTLVDTQELILTPISGMWEDRLEVCNESSSRQQQQPRSNNFSVRRSSMISSKSAKCERVIASVTGIFNSVVQQRRTYLPCFARS
jgi:hypothetical protein